MKIANGSHWLNGNNKKNKKIKEEIFTVIFTQHCMEAAAENMK
jgi:hypothetical protein